MSTLAATYLKDRATIAQLPITSVIKGAAKAWGEIVQAGTQSYAGFNIASVTDGGVGVTAPVTFTAPLVTQSYNTTAIQFHGQVNARVVCTPGPTGISLYVYGSMSADTGVDGRPTFQTCGDLA